MRPRLSRLITLAACAWMASACEIAKVTVANPQASVIVHAVLNPDEEEQVILVESSLTGRVSIDDTLHFDALDPIRTAGGQPISSADVRLLAGTDSVGVRATETQVNGRGTGRYAVPRSAFAVEPGRTYRLRIRTTDGVVVTGQTTVPTAAPGWTRGVGSSPIATNLFRSTDTLRLSWTPIPDAATYAIRIESPDGPWFLFSDSTRFTLAGSLRNFFAPSLPSLWYPGFMQSVSVVAVDKNFYDYNRTQNDPFGGTGLLSSVTGGLGMFGSAIPLLRRDVTVTDRNVAPIDARWIGTGSNGVRVDMDLWLESPGPKISSVSGRARSTSDHFVIGTLASDTIRLVTLTTMTKRDTLAAFSGRVLGDSIVGSYNPRFATSGPTVFKRQARTP